MAETSTQALIDEANEATAKNPWNVMVPAFAERDLFRRLAAELARLSTRPEGSNVADVASVGMVLDDINRRLEGGGAVGETVPTRDEALTLAGRLQKLAYWAEGVDSNRYTDAAGRKWSQHETLTQAAHAILALTFPPHPASEDS